MNTYAPCRLWSSISRRHRYANATSRIRRAQSSGAEPKKKRARACKMMICSCTEWMFPGGQVGPWSSSC